MAQRVKSPPAMWETQVWSLGPDDPLEKGKATHFSILAWRIPWTEESGGLQSMGLRWVRQDWATNTYLCISRCLFLWTRSQILAECEKQASGSAGSSQGWRQCAVASLFFQNIAVITSHHRHAHSPSVLPGLCCLSLQAFSKLHLVQIRSWCLLTSH